MSTELTVLALAALLQAAQFVLMAVPLNIQLGPDVTAGPRDTMPALTGIGGRLHRAFTNHFEALILFTIAVFLVTSSDQSTSYTAACAWIYLGARVVYIPAYVSGIHYVRSTVWFIGFLATFAMILATLF